MVITAQLEAWRVPRPATTKQYGAAPFLVISALLFACSAAWTVYSCSAMPEMGAMPMPGGWSMSMAWMRMPGCSWLVSAASFTGMWAVMMIAMMLPSLTPTLWRYREALARAGDARPDRQVATLTAAYFLVWTAIGMALYPIGALFASLEMQHASLARAVPAATAIAVLIAGVLQFTGWKRHHLAYCREAPRGAGAWRRGLRLGLHCSYGCAGWTAILLAMGVMDLRVMATVTAAITAERTAPTGERTARALGVAVIAAGLLLLGPAR